MAAPSPPSESERFRMLQHAGRPVVLLDFTGITDRDEGLAAVDRARAFVAALPCDGSHLTLTDVRRTRYDRTIVEAFKELSEHNRPYVRAAAVVSDSAIHRAAITMIALFSRRKLAVFDTREAALEYLARAAAGTA